MPITPFLNGERFDLEGECVLRLAFEMVCIGLRTGDCDDGVKTSNRHEAHRAGQNR
jgi:hypothetical protein